MGATWLLAANGEFIQRSRHEDYFSSNSFLLHNSFARGEFINSRQVKQGVIAINIKGTLSIISFCGYQSCICVCVLTGQLERSSFCCGSIA